MPRIRMTDRIAAIPETDWAHARKFMNDMAKEAGIETEGGAVPDSSVSTFTLDGKLYRRPKDDNKGTVKAYVKNEADANKLIKTMAKHGAKGNYDTKGNAHWVSLEILGKKLLTGRLDVIASELEQVGDLRMALALDQISDKLEGR